jgi:hypothetical protein
MAMSQAALIYVSTMLLLFTFCHLGEDMTRQVTNLMSHVISLLFHIVTFRRGKRVYNLNAALHRVH